MNADFASWRRAISPNRVALTTAAGNLTYAKLHERAAKAAALFAQHGVTKGSRVAVLAHNSVAHFDVLLGAPKTGFIANPYNTRLSLHEQRTLLAKIRPTVLIHDEAHAKMATALGEELGFVTYSLPAYEAALASVKPIEHTVSVSPNDPHMMLFTGGTTGLPKGALLPHRQTFYNALNTVYGWGLGPNDVVIQATPAFHAAVNAVAIPLLHAGGRVVLQEQFDPAEYLALVEQERPTILFLVPTMYEMLAHEPAFATTDFSSVQWAISGGAACPEPLAKRFTERGVRFRQGYGLTEAGVNCFTIEQHEADAYPDAVGRPMPYSEMRLVTESGEDAATNEVGELYIKGPHVFLGYYEEPAETKLALRGNWLATGDFATRDEAGLYRIVGRKKEMFISGGENVFPNEVEAALFNHPAVRECAVVPVPDEKWGEVGCAYVVVSSPVTEAELHEFLTARLARYKVPKRFIQRDSLPKSAAGKIVKTELGKEQG